MRRVLASVGRRGRGLGVWLGLLVVAAACAERAPPQTPDAVAAPGEATPSDAPSAEVAPAGELAAGSEASASAGDEVLDADLAELSASTSSGEAPLGEPASSAAKPEAPSGRDVVYRVTPKGLVIEIDGFHLRPEAKPFKAGSGAYGIELTLRAESFDGRQFWVDTPKEGPLSIAGKVQGKDGKVERFVDEHGTTSDEQVVLREAPHTFVQRWPGRGQPKLRAGQTVTLEVGLWGVRAESERERPVRRLFTVKMVAGDKSPAVIEPPAMDWGS